MLTERHRLIAGGALVVALALAVVWLLLAQPSPKAAGAAVSAPPQTARSAPLDRAGPDIRAGRGSKLEELMRLDGESAPWLGGLLRESPADGVPSGGGVRPPAQVASVAADERGSASR